MTDYDVWKEKPVDVEQVIATMSKNMSNVKKLLTEGIAKLPSERDCECKDALKGAEI